MINLKQINSDELNLLKLDFFIASSGFESRAIAQTEKYSQNSNIKIVLGFSNELDDETRIYNDSIFEKNNFSEQIIMQGEEKSIEELNKIINTIDNYSNNQECTRVYIDYSCMTRNWYSYLLFGLDNIDNKDKVKIYFGYSHAEHVPNNGDSTFNRVVCPLLGYCDLNVPSKPTALIIGMGNEPNRIYGLKEYFDAASYLFYSDESYNEKYSEEIENINKDIIDSTKPENIFTFPIHDLIYTNYILESLCNALMKEYRVVIAPCGPKPFALLAMINSLKYDYSLEVWRISPGDRAPKVDRKPTGLISVVELSFSALTGGSM